MTSIPRLGIADILSRTKVSRDESRQTFSFFPPPPPPMQSYRRNLAVSHGTCLLAHLLLRIVIAETESLSEVRPGKIAVRAFANERTSSLRGEAHSLDVGQKLPGRSLSCRDPLIPTTPETIVLAGT